MTELGEILTAARHDLDLIEPLLKWAHADGYQPEGPTTRRPGSKPPQEHADPDFVPGARDDTGLGNYRRRGAWQVASVKLARVEVYLASALRHARQPALTHPGPTSTDLTLTVSTIRLRLQILGQQGYASGTLADVEHARTELDYTFRNLEACFTEHAEPESAPSTKCRTCLIRDVESRSECGTCRVYKRRHGHARPRELDDQGQTEAEAASVRRQRRGDAWGDESASCTQPLRPADPHGQRHRQGVADR